MRLLDYRSRRADQLERACALRPVLPTPVPTGDLPLYFMKAVRLGAALRRLPRSHPFDLHNPSASPECEAAVIGSDEVWNFAHPMYPGMHLFFGKGLRSGRLLSYAASVGGYTGEIPDWAAKELGRFHAISVRDESSRSVIGRALGRSVPVVPDPCLQFPPDVRPAAFSKPTLVVYGHNFDPVFASAVQDHAIRNGLPIVSVGYRNAWAHRQWITASPREFAGAIRAAACVATNFFHGCIFSLLAKKPFVAELSPYRSTKVADLLSRLGCTQRAASGDAVHIALDNAPDTSVYERLKTWRSIGDAYLEAAGV